MDKRMCLKGAEKFYRDGGRRDVVKAVNGVDMEVCAGEILGIIGESGCGKSTLGRLMVGLEDSYGGDILYEGREIRDWLRRDRKAFRRQVQMIYQNPYDVFDRRFTIEKILLQTLRLHRRSMGREEAREIIEGRMVATGIQNPEELLKRYPGELSGGQLQRIAILRSILLDPDFVVADEIVSMLDVSVRAEIMKVLLDIIGESEMTMVLISHDIMSTRIVADRVAVMYLGEIVEIGGTGDVMGEPMHPYTKALISNSRGIDPEVKLSPMELKSDMKYVEREESCFFANRCPYKKEICSREHPKLGGDGPRKVRCFLYT